MLENIYSRAKEIYSEKRELALKTNSNFSFQTNFHTQETIQTILHFKNKGYKIRLIYLYIQSIEICRKRVQLRISQGGHFVPFEEINNRFILGLQNLDRFYHLFNEVQIINTSESTNPTLMIEIKDSKIKMVDPQIFITCQQHNLSRLYSDIIQKLN